MSTILECTDLDHSYGKKQALKNISLTVESGKIVGLFGPNGSGKTTLIKMIAGMIHDENKCIRVCREPVGEKTKAVISYSPDRMVLGQDRKVSGLLDMYELMYEDFDRGNAEENLKKLNIEKDDYVGKLSKGNAEKVQILLTMSRKAKLFVLDEPFNGVDPVARESIIKLMLGCVPEDSSLLISTHQIGDIEQILDEAVFIKEGQLLFHRSVDEIRSGTGRSLTETYMEEFR
ncbi:MAG: ABC transporter ATP-binding protein [Lachnospiraceae bacterium]|nr:ABC transporter ATP-binding protein [Lachnospiraceae bacterium]